MFRKFIRIVSVSAILTFIFVPVYVDMSSMTYVIHVYSASLQIDKDTLWDNNTDLSVYNVINIDSGATLTISPGTHLSVPDIYVYDGSIIAQGTSAEHIVLTSVSAETLVDDSEQYDAQCFEKGSTIAFDVDLASHNAPSLFAYVDFVAFGMNAADKDLDCPWEGLAQRPAVLHQSGKVEFDNVVFRDNHFADVKVEIELGSQHSDGSSVHVKNSNFEHNTENTAILSTVGRSDADEFFRCADQCYTDGGGPMICDRSCFDDCRIMCEAETVISDKTKVVLENNWYGHENGPAGIFSEGEDLGEIVSGDLTLDGWRTNAHMSSNVLFFPGAKASSLYDGSNKVWPPSVAGDDYKNLLADTDGVSMENIHVGEAIKEVGMPIIGGNIYKSFIGDLANLKRDGVIADYTAFAYDWRYNIEDIVRHGVLYAEDEVKFPIAELEGLAGSSISGQVTIVAHSNGGLLAKALMISLEKQGKEDLVDNIIFASTPQIGTPKAVLTMLYGFDEGISIPPGLISDEEAREVTENMPAAYGLLPTAAYFRRIQSPLINFLAQSGRSGIFRDAYGEDIDDHDEFQSFLLAKDDNRQKPEKEEVDKENILNEKLFTEMQDTHERLSNWTPPDHVHVIQIGGWGLDTISGINYDVRGETVCENAPDDSLEERNCHVEMVSFYEPVYTVDGDDVVVTPSSLMMDSTDNVEKYWLDLYRKGYKLKKIEFMQTFLR